MRSFGSLIRGGYIPSNGTPLYMMNQNRPYVQFERFNYNGSSYRSKDNEMIFKPNNRKPKLDILYIHPYFPDYPIHAVKILKPFPFAKANFVYHLDKGILHLTSNIRFIEQDIYNYPTFFKPIYANY